MKLEQLYYFCQAVKYRSISEAAKNNYISQSSLSGAISKLEKELGADLLRRSNAGVEPTAFGNIVLTSAEKIFQAQNEILDAADSIQYKGTVLVNCIPGIHNRVLLETVRRLKESQSDLVLSVKTAESLEIARNISSGFADIGIIVKGDFLNAFHDLVYHPLFRDEYQLYVGQKSPLWERKNVMWQEVRQQRQIGFLDEFRKNNGGIMEIFETDEQQDIAFWTDDLDSMKRMISESDCVALFAVFMGKKDLYLKSGLIRSIPIADRDTSFEVGYLESRKYRLTNSDKEVVRALQEAVADLLQGYRT